MNQFRLSSNPFQREDPANARTAKKFLFIATEGNHTEIKYLEGLSDFKNELKLNVEVAIIPLKRKDTNSAPKHVISLLKEHEALQKNSLLSEIRPYINQEISDEIIERYINGKSIAANVKKNLDTVLKTIGYNLEYRKELKNLGGSEEDIHAIVIDKDDWDIDSVIKTCETFNYKIFIINPCFELWLLLHHVDLTIPNKFIDLDKIKENPKVSAHHTYVSKLLSDKCNHTKKNIQFKKNYLNNIDNAISNANRLPNDVESLRTNIGTNFHHIFDLLK